MEDIVNRIFTNRIAVRVEKPKGKIAAGVDCEANFGYKIACGRSRLCTSDGTCNIGITNAKLVVVLRIGTEPLCLDLRLS